MIFFTLLARSSLLVFDIMIKMSTIYHRLPRELIRCHILPWLYLIDPLSLRVTGHILYREHDLLTKASLATPDMYERYLDSVILPWRARTIHALVSNKCFSFIVKLAKLTCIPYETTIVDWFYTNRRYLDLIPRDALNELYRLFVGKGEVLVSLYILRLLEGYDSWVNKIRGLFDKPKRLQYMVSDIVQSPYDKDIIEHIDPSVWKQAVKTYKPNSDINVHFFTVENKQIRYGDQVLTPDQFVEYCRNTPCLARRIVYSVWKDILRYELVPLEQAYASIFSSYRFVYMLIPLLVDILQDVDLCDKINNEVVERMGDTGLDYIHEDWINPVIPDHYYLAFFTVLDWFERKHRDNCPGLAAFQDTLSVLRVVHPNLGPHDGSTMTLIDFIFVDANTFTFEQLRSCMVPLLITYNNDELDRFKSLESIRADELGNEEDNYKLLCERTNMTIDEIKYIVDSLWW